MSQRPKGRIDIWLKAFRGFYDKSDPVAAQDLIAKFLFSARSLILVISAQAAIIAGLLAYIAGEFNPFLFLLTLVGFVTIHAASNLMNDYFGFLRGHDTVDSPRRRYTLHPLADNVLTVGQMGSAIAFLILVSVAIAFYLTLVRGFVIVILAILGLAFLFLYDAAPRPLKSIGLGEIAAFIVWGPLMIVGGNFVIGGYLSLGALMASIPYGLGVMSILMGKHIDQEDFDRRKGVDTLPVIVGGKNARLMTIVSVLLMYVFTVGAVAYGAMPATALIVFLNYRRLVNAFRVLSRDRPAEPPSGYIGWPLWYHRHCLKHNKSFGWLYIAALLGAAIIRDSQFSRYVFVRLT